MIDPQYRTSDVVGLVRAWADVGFDHQWQGCSLLADALKEAGFQSYLLGELRERELSRSEIEELKSLLPVPPPLGEGSWQEVFAYAGEGGGSGDGMATIKAAEPGTIIDLSPFTRYHVAEVFGLSEGENDTTNWLVYGRLNDGRYFFITAGCDYTGWG